MIQHLIFAVLVLVYIIVEDLSLRRRRRQEREINEQRDKALHAARELIQQLKNNNL